MTLSNTLHVLRIFLCLFPAVIIHGYYSQIYFKDLQSSLIRAKPLRTAGGQLPIGAIPRLEPGLRLLRWDRKNQRALEKHPFVAQFPLSNLINGPDRVDATVKRESIEAQVGKLFGEASHGWQSFSRKLMRSLRRVAAAATVFASSFSPAALKNSQVGLSSQSNSNTASAMMRTLSTSLPMRRVGLGLGSIATAMSTIGPQSLVRANAGALKRYSKLSPIQRLATTPLFYVSNSRGNSYLQEDIQAGRPDQRVVVYFMSSEDANAYLDEMAQVNSQSANEFRIMTVSMEKVVNQIIDKKQSRKLGRYNMDMVYRIQPSSRQCENAELVAGKGNAAAGAQAMKGVSIPMFSAQGLAFRRSSGEIITPYYFAYEDLKDDWNKMVAESEKKASSTAVTPPAAPKVVVKDFTEVMCLAKGISTNTLKGYKDSTSKLKALSKLEVKPPQLVSITSTKTNSKPKTKTKTESASTASGSDKMLTNAAAGNKGLTQEQVQKALETPGIVPPRREIDMIRRYYRNRGMIRNEYNRAKYIGPK